MTTNDNRITIRIDPKLRSWLIAESKRSQRSLSNYVNMKLGELMKGKTKKK